MFGRKPVIVILMCALAFSATACTKKEGNAKELEMRAGVVKQAVKDWRIYTNPAFRYELRFPQNWDYASGGEDGAAAALFPRGLNSETDGVFIRGVSNWAERYDLEEFYRHQPVDLLKSEYAGEEIKIGKMKGVWFKDVTGRVPGKPDQKVDLIAFELADRILEIEIRSDWDISAEIVNSLNFYGINSLKDLPEYKK
ncbi:MAG: hypothetical protein V1928_04260 [Parcubacteria group bacterium]